jgi:hypothetical protein
MINWEVYAKTAAVIAGYFAIRVIAGWRVDRRKRVEMTTPLVDPILLETTFAPHEGDDANLLAEVRDTLAHLNRRAYAEEFWNISDQIVALDKKLPKPAKATLRRAARRMLDTDDRWLQIVGAKTSRGLKVSEAAPRLRALIDEIGDASDDPVSARFGTVLADALGELEPISVPTASDPMQSA